MSRSSMNKEECFRLGTIVNTHGIKGELVCILDSEDPGRYRDLSEVLIEANESLVPHQVTGFDIKPGNKAFLSLDGVDSLTLAEPFKGSPIYLPLSRLPDLEDGRFYIHDAFGYEVHDRVHGLIGKFEGVVEAPGNPLAIVRQGDREVLVPLVSDFLESIDHERKALHVALPDGLVELYR
jgi:16S rRNA processing protein RimM